VDNALSEEIRKGEYDWALHVGTQAVVWGLPIVECWADRLKKLRPAAHAAPEPGLINRFRHVRALSRPGASEFVNAATDFLYSTAVVDLRDGPLRLTVGDAGERWYGLQILDAHMETLANVGTRTFGPRPPPTLLIHEDGPGASEAATGEDGEHVVRSACPFLYIVGRISAAEGPDLDGAHRFQDSLDLAVAGARRDLPPGDAEAHAPLPDDGDPLAFYARLAHVLHVLPPRRDEGMLAGMLARFGIGPNRLFDPSALSEPVRRGLSDAVAHAHGILARKLYTTGRMIDGWMWVTDLGNYGSDYIVRALVAQHGIWANVPEESLYVMGRLDGAGALLHGAYRYQIRFPPGGTPPVDAFWSISYYDEHGRLNDHPSGRTTVNSLHSPLIHDEDGGLTIEIGPSPSRPERAANWLAAHDGPFNLNLRCYNPRPEMLQNAYRVPAVTRVD